MFWGSFSQFGERLTHPKQRSFFGTKDLNSVTRYFRSNDGQRFHG